jgi:transcription antitermination factor NusG
MDPYPFAAVGRRCRVTAGPLEGMEGIVVRRDKLARLVLEVSILGQGASVEIDADLLEALD